MGTIEFVVKSPIVPIALIEAMRDAGYSGGLKDRDGAWLLNFSNVQARISIDANRCLILRLDAATPSALNVALRRLGDTPLGNTRLSIMEFLQPIDQYREQQRAAAKTQQDQAWHKAAAEQRLRELRAAQCQVRTWETDARSAITLDQRLRSYGFTPELADNGLPALRMGSATIEIATLDALRVQVHLIGERPADFAAAVSLLKNGSEQLRHVADRVAAPAAVAIRKSKKQNPQQLVPTPPVAQRTKPRRKPKQAVQTMQKSMTYDEWKQAEQIASDKSLAQAVAAQSDPELMARLKKEWWARQPPSEQPYSVRKSLQK